MLCHLAALGVENKTVYVDLLRDGEARRVEHAGPDHRVKPDDVLANDVHIRWPVAVVEIFGFCECRNVIGERVEPDVHDVLGVVRHRNSPVESRSRDREVPDLVFEPGENLVTSLRWVDEPFVLLNMLSDPVLIFAESKEIGLLLNPFGGAVVYRAFAIFELRLSVEALAGDTVVSFVLTFVNVALFHDLAVYLLREFVVSGRRRANEVVV